MKSTGAVKPLSDLRFLRVLSIHKTVGHISRTLFFKEYLPVSVKYSFSCFAWATRRKDQSNSCVRTFLPCFFFCLLLMSVRVSYFIGYLQYSKNRAIK